MHCTHEQVIGNHLYSGRVLGMTEPEDIIQLHPDLKLELNAITEHYARIGLSHSKNVVWDTSFSVLADYPDYEISVFFFGDAVHKASLDEDWFSRLDQDRLKVVQFINSKNNFIQLAEELGVSVPKTLCAKNKAAIKNYAQLPYPCYLKPAVSVNGAGISRCENEQQLIHALKTLEDDIPLQVQEEVIASNFLNLQYHVTSQGVEHLAATEQVLEGYAHRGNRYPTAYQPWEIVEPMAEWMAKHGMKEVFAFDVAVVEATDTRYLAIECNPRFNGASYPTGIANKLKITSWTSETFASELSSINEIDLTGIEFNSESGTGAIIVNWGTILFGKVAVLLAGSVEKQNELRAVLQQRLGKPLAK
jgi:hypothetical protein